MSADPAVAPRPLQVRFLAPAFADSSLATFAADEIVLVPSPRRRRWAEKRLFEHVCERFGLPVREIELSEDAAGVHAVQVACTAG